MNSRVILYHYKRNFQCSNDQAWRIVNAENKTVNKSYEYMSIHAMLYISTIALAESINKKCYSFLSRIFRSEAKKLDTENEMDKKFI
jgi:hypothetical protein